MNNAWGVVTVEGVNVKGGILTEGLVRRERKTGAAQMVEAENRAEQRTYALAQLSTRYVLCVRDLFCHEKACSTQCVNCEQLLVATKCECYTLVMIYHGVEYFEYVSTYTQYMIHFPQTLMICALERYHNTAKRHQYIKPAIVPSIMLMSM